LAQQSAITAASGIAQGQGHNRGRILHWVPQEGGLAEPSCP
jgi:hypothetical protein